MSESNPTEKQTSIYGRPIYQPGPHIIIEYHAQQDMLQLYSVIMAG